MTRKIKAIIVGLKKQFYKIRQLNKHDKAHECKKIHVLFCNHADCFLKETVGFLFSEKRTDRT